MRWSWFTALWTCWWGGCTLVMLFMAVSQWTGLDPARDDEAAFGGMIVAILTGAMTLAGALMARRKGSVPVPGLAEAAAELATLLSQLSDRDVPAPVIDRARRIATVAASRIRVVAARIDTAERLLPHVSPRERVTFEDGLGSLRLHLDQALDAYGGLVAAAERVLLTGTDELATATDRLADATEALREVSVVDRW